LYAVYGGYAKPNPLLKPEYSRGTELGFKHHYTVRDWQLQHTFTLFDQDIHNKITYVTDPTTYVGQSVNREHVTVRGAEWLSEASLKSWRMGANLSYQEVVDQATQRRETRQPYVLGSVWVGYHQEQWHTQMTLSGQGARYDGTKPLAGYGTLDVQAGYRLNATTQLGVRVNNALNRQYETAYGYNSLPRLAMATLTYHF
jgi:vitamin B12 transporter